MSQLREEVRRAPIPRGVWGAASVLALGAFLANMDGSIVALGLPAMRAGLHTSLTAIQWVATAYLLGLCAGLPLTPWLVHRLGAGRLWLWALAGFVITSAMCALAPTAPALIAVRGAQGMTAGVLVAAGQTVIGLAVGPARLGRMMGSLGLVVGLAPIVGPIVGGALLSWTAWPALFWLNVPVGLVALGLALRWVPRGERGTPPRIDWPGLVLVSTGLPLLVYALTALGAPDTATAPAYLPLAVGVAALGTFGWRSLRAPDPVLRIRLAAHPVPAAGLLTVLTGGASMFGAVLLVPLWFQLRLGEGSASTGLLLAPMGAGTTLVVLSAGRLADRYGGGAVALAGSAAVLVSTVPFGWLGPDTPMLAVQALLVLRGAGLGLAVLPAMTAIYASVQAPDLGDATALANIAMRLGGAGGGAAVVIVLSRGLASAGPAAGFRAAFGVLGGVCVLATAAAGWLYQAESTSRKVHS